MNEIAQRFNNIPEVAGDAHDLKGIERVKAEKDNSKGITLEEMDTLREKQGYNGKISLRLPKSLHKNLVQGAKKEGVSLNQFILYKLAK